MRLTFEQVGRIMCGMAIFVAVSGQAPPQPTSPPQAAPRPAPAAPIDPKRIDEILAKWEVASKGITSLYAEFEQVDKLVIVGDEKKYKGKAYLQSPNKALLQFEKENPNKPGEFIFERRILCSGEEVMEFDAAVKQVVIFPLPKDAAARAMEEGPLRFLFGMQAESFKQRYQASLRGENPKTYRIELLPLTDVDKQAFAKAVLDLNVETLLPDAIYLLSPNGKDRQTYSLKKIQPNATWPGQDAIFAWNLDQERALAKKGWRVIHNPSPEQTGPELEAAPRGAIGRATPSANPAPR
jgi:TIGR03009 family protein